MARISLSTLRFCLFALIVTACGQSSSGPSREAVVGTPAAKLGPQATPRLTNPLFVKVPNQATAVTTMDMLVEAPTFTGSGRDTTDAVVSARVLQGLVNRASSNKLYLINDANDAFHKGYPYPGNRSYNWQLTMLDTLPELKSLPRTTLNRAGGLNGGLRGLLGTYSSYVKGLVVWDDRNTAAAIPQATSAIAITIAAQRDALAVSPALRDQLIGWGFNFPVLVDLRTQNFTSDHQAVQWSIDNYWATSNRDLRAVFAMSIDMFDGFPGPGWGSQTKFNEGAIDYVVATKGFAINPDMTDANDDTVLLNLLRKYTEGQVAILGWLAVHPGGNTAAETPKVLDGTSYYVMGGNGLSNFSALASFADSSVNLPAPVAQTVSGSDVYLNFYVSDGDALHYAYIDQFLAFTSERAANHGAVPISFTFPPVFAQLAPAYHNYMVNNLPAGSGMLLAWADKTNGAGDTGLAALAASFKEYADLTDIRSTWTVHSQEDSQRADLVGWESVVVGYDNSRLDPKLANLNANTAVFGTWNLVPEGSSAAVTADEIRKIAASKPAGTPIFMNVRIQKFPNYYDWVKDIRDNLAVNPAGRTYKFVSAQDMAATYKRYRGAEPSNLITNGDFEQNPVNANTWATQNWNNNASFTWATDAVHGGARAAKISGTGVTAGYNKDDARRVVITGGQAYTLRAWLRTANVTGTGAWIWTEQFDAAGNLIAGTRWDSPKLAGTADWREITRTFTTAANAARMNLYVHLEGTGTAWYDDLSLGSGSGPGTRLFYDGFEDGDATGWTTSGGAWGVCGADAQASATFCKSSAPDSQATAGDSTWTNYSVTGYVNLRDDAADSGAYLMGRVQDGTHFYVMGLKKQASGAREWEIWKNDGGAWSKIAGGSSTFAPNTYALLRFDLNGSTLTAAVSTDNGANFTVLGSGTDGRYTSGKIGVRAFNTTARFDDIQVVSR